jgi:hypothetical protein
LVIMIVGLHGLKNSGKDTVAAYLIKRYGFERRAFADPLKKSVAALLDIPYHVIDKWKNDPRIVVDVQMKDGNVIGGIGDTLSTHTFREFLQRYGTESHRDVFGENFWVDQTLPTSGYYSGKKIVVTDCRFIEEARRIRSIGGFIVEVQRPGLESKDQHRSEQPLPVDIIDYVLVNDSALDDLFERIEVMLVNLANTDNTIKAMFR